MLCPVYRYSEGPIGGIWGIQADTHHTMLELLLLKIVWYRAKSIVS
jgi:hypothetical protein